jgi:hypothetical protein
MSVVEDHIKRINEKLQIVLKRLTSLQKENTRLKEEVATAKKKTEEQKEQLDLLTQRIEVLKASKGTMTEEEKDAFEKRLRQYIKEIDKCIAFLND